MKVRWPKRSSVIALRKAGYDRHLPRYVCRGQRRARARDYAVKRQSGVDVIRQEVGEMWGQCKEGEEGAGGGGGGA